MYIRRHHNGNTIATVAIHKHCKKIEMYNTANTLILPLNNGILIYNVMYQCLTILALYEQY